jgi:predicted aldo/keto reductase-like oxidoreductase
MIYRKFGKTGLLMPVLTCGLMRSMFSWKDMGLQDVPENRQRDQAAVVAAALERGMNHFETARAYGSSERQLGRILSDYARSSYILQTKVRLEDDPDLFIAHVLDSLDRLGHERIDLLALHGINDYHSLWQACRPRGCLAAARRLQEQGKVGWVGFSGHGELPVLLSAVQHEGDGGFDYMNLHWYTIFQRNTPALVAAAERNMGIYIISPTDKGGLLQAPPELLVEASRPLSPLQFNGLFCLQRPEISSIGVGAARPDDFTALCEALKCIEDRQLVGRIYSRWQEIMQERIGHPDADGPWSRFPSWTITPGYINIPFILWLYNLALGWDMLEYARYRYRMLGTSMPWVAGNNACMADRFDLKEIARSAGMEEKKLVEQLSEAHLLLGADQPRQTAAKD